MLRGGPGVANDRNAGIPASASEGARDGLSDALRAVRLTGALFFMVDASPPWRLDLPEARSYGRIVLPRAQRILSYHVALDDAGWASVPGAPPVRFDAGDVILFPHGDPYVMRSGLEASPELDHDATLDFFRALAQGSLPFTVRVGRGDPPPARFICGYLGCDERPFNPLLAGLPRLLRLPGAARAGALAA